MIAAASQKKRTLIKITQPRRKSLARTADARAAMDDEQRGRARCGEAFRGNAGAGELRAQGHTMLDIPPGLNGRRPVSARAGRKLQIERPKIEFAASSCAHPTAAEIGRAHP